ALERARPPHHAPLHRGLPRRLSGARRRHSAHLGRRLPARGAGRALIHPGRWRLFHHPRPAAFAAAVVPVWPRHRTGASCMNAYETLLSEARGRPFAAIVGWPVEHSRSPALHGFWLRQQGIDGHYGRLPVEPKRAALEELVGFLRKTPNARGCNLT